MRQLFYLFFLLTILSCDRVSKKAKDTINKTGEVVAESGSEFVDGVGKGIEKAFGNEIVLSDSLQAKGLKFGKIEVTSTDSTSDNVLTVYVIFEKSFNSDVMAKVFDRHGAEYGRAKTHLSGGSEEGKYFDFIFDKRTDISGKGKVVFE